LSKYGKTQSLLDEVHSRMRQRRLERRLTKNRNGAPTNRKKMKRGEEVEKTLSDKGLDGAKVRARSASRKSKREGDTSLLGKRKRDASAGTDRAESAARGRSASMLKGMPSDAVAQKAEKVRRKKMRRMEKFGKKGEADKHIPDWKPKHLYSGKRGIGKTDRR